MGNTVNIEEYKPHEVAETICLFCFNRTISVYPVKALLKTHECGNCWKIGGIIKTGQSLDTGTD